MRTCTTFSVLLAFCALSSAAPPLEEKEIPPELKPFILEGTSVLTFGIGDLNGDGLRDYVLVLQKKDDKKPGSRPLLIVTRDKSGALKLAKRNDKLVFCADCGIAGGEASQDLEVKTNSFTVYNYGGAATRWSNSYTFAFAPKENTWQLVHAKETAFAAADPEKTHKNDIYTSPKDFGKVSVSEFDPEHYVGTGAK